MEFFLELALTISLPLFLSYFIAKFLSKDPTDEKDELVSFGFDFPFGSRIHDLKCDKKEIFVEDLINDDEIDRQSKQGNPTVVESLVIEERMDEESGNGVGHCDNDSADNVSDESPVSAGNEESGDDEDEKVVVENNEDGVFESDQSKGFDGVNEEKKSMGEMIDDDGNTNAYDDDGIANANADDDDDDDGIANANANDDDDDDDDDDDWEGIERTELEKVFDSAVEFVEIKQSKNFNFESELKMKLFGFHKIAIEGPCRESPPMALKISARAKWNAWKQLGNITPEEAMECYINLVSEKIPGWMHKSPTENNEQDASHTCESGKLASETKPQ